MNSNLQFLTILFCITCLFLSCESKEAKVARLKAQMQTLRAAQSEFEKTQYIVKEGRVKAGQGLFQALSDVGLTAPQALKIINQLSDYVEFSKLKVGDKLMTTYNSIGTPIKFEFSNNPAEFHILNKENSDSEWKYSFTELPTQWKTRLISGTLAPDSILQNDLLAKGIGRSVVGEIIDILLCKINFRLYARSGDEFEVLLKERLFNDEILETKILYTSYSGVKAGKSQAYFYDDGDNKSTYTAHYTEEGEALIRSGLRYPLQRLHIRSSYGKRRHPVTGRMTMHRGVDLRGRKGTAVHAVAHGVVVESSKNKYAGNKIAIRHADKSTSYYLHLNKRNVKVGDYVRSHQVIGSVGATGRVTGPHLHFGFKKPNGKWMNPMNKRMIATPKLKGEKLANLQKQIVQIKALLSKTIVTQNDIKAPQLKTESAL